MCLGNRAESSAHYINGQLATLWENARRCTEKHGDGKKPTSSVVEYSTCLYEYYGPGKHGRYQPSRFDLSFFAAFGRPHVEFVCNHEVILFLEILEGHYNLDFNKNVPNKAHNEKIENFTVAFRVNFSTHSIEKFHCKAIGNLDNYTMDMHILDVDTAVLVPEHSNMPGITSVTDEKSFHVKERKLHALTHYLTKCYLQTFKRAGLHVLHSLPDFDNLTDTIAHVDYSVISKRSLSTETLYGITIEEINKYLRGLWLQAASYIDEHGTGHHDEESMLKHFLAEHRTIWTESAEDIHMHLYFGPMQIRALCKREVVVYFDIRDAHFYIGAGFHGEASYKFSGWKIAFIVNVTYQECDEGSVRRIKLDLSSARFCEHLSTFAGTIVDVELFSRIRKTIVRYIHEYYFAFLERTHLCYIFHHDERHHKDVEGSEPGSPGVEDPDCPHCHHGHCEVHTHHDSHEYHQDCKCTEEGSCGHSGVKWGIIEGRRLTCGVEAMKHFDFVTAVTQHSLNYHLRQLWVSAYRRHRALDSKCTWGSKEIEEETCLADYSFVHHEHGEEVFFSASFTAPKVRLICKEGSHKVVLYLHLTQGYLKALGQKKSYMPEHQAYAFSNWYLAFQVDLKLVNATKETLSEAILKKLGNKDHQHFKQLVLDLSTAKFDLSLSTVPGLLDADDCLVIRQRHEAIVHYVGHHYLNVLQRANHHVLYTIPIHVHEKHTGHHEHALTSIKFEIVPFIYSADGKYVEGLYGRHKGLFDRNMIVFYGVCGGRALPEHGASRHNWVCGGARHEIPHGSIVLSRKHFLERRILSRLEEINKDTTIVPEFLGVHHGDWKLRLTTWGKHAIKKDCHCHWKQVSKSDETLDFEWKNKELWRYEHEGDMEGNGLYSVSCVTHNALSVPTTRRGTSGITVKGSLEFSMSYVGDGRQWSAKTKGSWSAVILFSSGARGLHVTLTPGKITPEFAREPFHGTFGHSVHEEAFKHLQEEFPKVIDFSHIVSELKAIFEGSWAGLHVAGHELAVSYPVFNRTGDLILELAPRPSENLTVQTSAHSINGSSVTLVGVNGTLHHSKSNGSLFHSVGKLVHKGMDALQSATSHGSPTRVSSPGVLPGTKKNGSTPSLSRSSSTSTLTGPANGNAKHANSPRMPETITVSEAESEDL